MVNISADWEERLRSWLDDFREENLLEYRKNSEEYKKLSKVEHKSHKKLDKLKLSKKERSVIEEVLDSQSATDYEYVSMSYLCGMADCIRFLSLIEKLKL